MLYVSLYCNKKSKSLCVPLQADTAWFTQRIWPLNLHTYVLQQKIWRHQIYEIGKRKRLSGEEEDKADTVQYVLYLDTVTMAKSPNDEECYLFHFSEAADKLQPKMYLFIHLLSYLFLRDLREKWFLRIIHYSPQDITVRFSPMDNISTLHTYRITSGSHILNWGHVRVPACVLHVIFTLWPYFKWQKAFHDTVISSALHRLWSTKHSGHFKAKTNKRERNKRSETAQWVTVFSKGHQTWSASDSCITSLPPSGVLELGVQKANSEWQQPLIVPSVRKVKSWFQKQKLLKVSREVPRWRVKKKSLILWDQTSETLRQHLSV